MEEQNNKKEEEKSNNGCLIVGIVVFVIVSTVVALKDSESVANTGNCILAILGLVIAYFVGKYIYNSINKISNNSKKKTSGFGCIAAIIVGICILMGVSAFAIDFDNSYVVGIIVLVIVAIAFGIYFISQTKDN